MTLLVYETSLGTTSKTKVIRGYSVKAILFLAVTVMTTFTHYELDDPVLDNLCRYSYK